MATIRKQGRRRGGTKRQRGAAERGGIGGKSLSRRMLTRARAFIQRDGLFPKSDHATWRAERGKDGETERIEAPPRRIGNWGKPVVATEKSHACGQVWVEGASRATAAPVRARLRVGAGGSLLGVDDT